MPAAAMRVLRSALDTGAFDSAYLFHGDDDYLKEEKVRALIERATDTGTREFNLEVRRGAETDAAGMEMTLAALPMMSERRVVVIRDVTMLRKDVRAVIDRYLESPPADVVLVLVASASTKPDSALIAKVTALDFQPLTDAHLLAWAEKRITTIGGTISKRAAELLCGATGNDLTLLAGEIDKLLAFVSGSDVDEAAVGAVVGIRHGESIGDLLDLVGQREGARSVALLERVLAQPKTTAVSIVMALTTQTLAIGWAIANQRVPRHRLEAEFYSFLGENRSSVVGRPWGEAVRGWVRAAPRWDSVSVDRALQLLLAADVSLKETRFSSDEQLLGSLLLAMGTDADGRAAA